MSGGDDLAGIIALLIPIFAVFSGAVIAVSAIVTRYKLKVEQIKADAMVRAEEVRAKNQLEIEKLLYHERTNTKDEQVKRSLDMSYDEAYTERRTKDKEKY